MLICSSYLRLLRCIWNNAELSASKNGRFLNEFEEPPDYSALSNATENTQSSA